MVEILPIERHYRAISLGEICKRLMGFFPKFEDVADDWKGAGAWREAGCTGFPANWTELEEMNACPHKGKQKQNCYVIHGDPFLYYSFILDAPFLSIFCGICIETRGP